MVITSLQVVGSCELVTRELAKLSAVSIWGQSQLVRTLDLDYLRVKQTNIQTKSNKKKLSALFVRYVQFPTTLCICIISLPPGTLFKVLAHSLVDQLKLSNDHSDRVLLTMSISLLFKHLHHKASRLVQEPFQYSECYL